jgi:radical SAM protein with 4Fe4S-binding SPASM domain
VIYEHPHGRSAAAEVGRDEIDPPPDDLEAATRGAFATPPRWMTLPEQPAFETDVVRVARDARYLDLTVILDLPWRETRRYEHSKLYFTVDAPYEFSESQVICLRVRWLRRLQTLRVLLPAAVRSAGRVRFRLDPFPDCSEGSSVVHSIRFVRDEARAEAASRIAELYALKEQVRHDVEEAETFKAEVCRQYPSSLSIELTPRCNLTCSHCSSHGEPDLDRHYNRMKEMTVERLERLAREAFPSATAIGLVGRGEPLASSNRLWRALVALLCEHRVLVTMVTNGTLLPRRITPEVLPHLETLNVSFDGATPQTFAQHRGGASFEHVIDHVSRFHEQRRASGLTRAPRLGFSWTLMRDNIEEFPRFVRDIIDLDPDMVTARHLLVFFDRMAPQSLVERPDVANEPLRDAYALLAAHDIRTDCPPLMQSAAPTDAPAKTAGRAGRDRCMFVHRTAVVAADGEVPTCSAPFAHVTGQLDDQPSFAHIWNGADMRAVRAALDTDREWDQCRNCWYHEGRYQRQRAKADRRATPYDLNASTGFTAEAWDFSSYEQ